MNLGYTFVNTETARHPSHLWFVISHPDGANRVVIVNVSSDSGGLDGLEGLYPGDHPWVQHYSFIRADRAMLAPVEAVEVAARSKAAKPEIAAVPATVTRLQLALGKSIHTKREVKRVLADQGFISPPTAR